MPKNGDADKKGKKKNSGSSSNNQQTNHDSSPSEKRHNAPKKHKDDGKSSPSGSRSHRRDEEEKHHDHHSSDDSGRNAAPRPLGSGGSEHRNGSGHNAAPRQPGSGGSEHRNGSGHNAAPRQPGAGGDNGQNNPQRRDAHDRQPQNDARQNTRRIPDPQYVINILQNNSQPEEKRRAVIKQKLVREKELEKTQRKAMEPQDSAQVTHDTSHTADNADAFAKYAGLGGLGVNSLAAVVPALGLTSMGAGLISGSKDTYDFGEKVMKDEDSSAAYNWTAAVGNGINTVASGTSLVSNIGRYNSNKSKYRRKVAGKKAWSAGFGTVGSGAAMFSNFANLGFFGSKASEAGTNSEKAGGILDVAAGIGDMGKTAFDIWGNVDEKQGHAAIFDGIDKKYHKSISQRELNNAQMHLYGARHPGLGRRQDRNAIEQARKERHTAKAKLYAMDQAKRLHGIQKDNANVVGRGLLSGSASLASGFGGILKGAVKWGNFSETTGGPIVSLIGAALGVLGTGLKVASAAKEKRHRDDIKGKIRDEQMKMLDEYLTSKVRKVKSEFQHLELSPGEVRALNSPGNADQHGNAARQGNAAQRGNAAPQGDAAQPRNTADPLTDDEAKIVVLLRLGINIPDNVKEMVKVSSDLKNEAFAMITGKRANNILQSENRDEMLGDLGLDTKASYEDVVKALNGGF